MILELVKVILERMFMKYILHSKKKQKYIIQINSKYIQNYTANAETHKVTGISWEIGDKPYPPINFKFEFDNIDNKTIISFNNYINICMKRNGVSSSILVKNRFSKFIQYL